ncbi:MAG: hypothetical protein ACOYOB_05070 [Myxococcota bacterium]
MTTERCQGCDFETLHNTVHELQQRVHRLESGTYPVATVPPPVVEPRELPSDLHIEGSVSALLGGVAVAAFVLLGALVLRVASQQGMLDAQLGTWLGLGYCALLLGAHDLLRRAPILASHPAVMAHAGVVLVPLIVLETVHKTQVLPIWLAVLVLAVAAAGAVVSALKHDKPSLAGLGLALAVLAIAGLGRADVDAWPRTATLVAATTAALVLAHRRWPFLRPLVLVPVGTVMGLATLLVAKRTETPPLTVVALVAGVGAIAALVLSSTAVRRQRLSTAEAAWLPVTFAWAFGLLAFAHGQTGAWLGVGLGVALALAGTVAARRGDDLQRLATTLITAGTLVAGLGLPRLEPTGIALACVGLVAVEGTRRLKSRRLAVLAMLLAGTAAVVAVVWGPADGVMPLVTGVCLAAILVLLAVRLNGAGLGVWGDWLAPAVLVAALVVGFVALRQGCSLFCGNGPELGLAETLILAVISLTGVTLGQRGVGYKLKILGFVGIGMLAVKVALMDLLSLSGGLLLGSVVALGVAFLAASWIVRRSGGAETSIGDRQ